MQKPSWCFIENTTYLIPASCAAAAQLSGSKPVGLKVLGRSSYILRYSKYGMSFGRAFICQETSSGQMDQDSTIPSWLYAPQWMNRPNLRSCQSAMARRTSLSAGALYQS